MKPGDRVFTKNDRFPISTGTVEHISSCQRYVRVRKRYGTRRSWVKVYYANELEPVEASNKVLNPTSEDSVG